jgi:hypothetical protein
MAVLTSYTTGDDAYYSAYIAPYYSLAQTFTLGRPALLTSITLKIFRNGSPSTCSITVRDTTDGEPNDTIEGTVGFNGDTITADTAGEWVDIPMPIPLAAGTYSVQLNANGVIADEDNTLHWRVDSSSATYAGGAAFHAEISAYGEYVEFAGQDFLFKINGAWTGPAPFTPPEGGPTGKRLIACANNRFWYEDI